MDLILNGQGHGNVANTLLAHDFDPMALRPYEHNGRSYVTRNQLQADGTVKPTAMLTNATSTLRVREWIELDQAIIRAARPRLRAVADLRSRGLTYNIPNGMGKTVLQRQRTTNPGTAIISMDGLRQGKGDRPVFDLTNLPLPIIHSDFGFSARDIAVSRNGGLPLDTMMAENAARKVADTAEQLLLGTTGSYAYGGGTIYGYTNFPTRHTYSMTNPATGPGWVPKTTLTEVLAMKQLSLLDFQFGPWMIYNSPLWDQYLDDDFSTAKGDYSLRKRLLEIKGVMGIETLDFLTGYRMIMVQMLPETVQEVIGMDIMTVQWQEQGGQEILFKVMCIMVPSIRADIDGNCGIIDGSA